MLEDHIQAREKIQKDLPSWTSNTVMVVDTSGSMRESDLWGTRNRLDAVFVSIALDYLAHRLESGHACVTDVLSVVTLGEQPKIVIEEEPCTWRLYNKIVDIYRKQLIQPKGHGPFLPALSIAEQLLSRNMNTSCANALLFLSDGRPSDPSVGQGGIDDIVDKVGSLASNFGRRLTFTAIGMGDYNEFDVLEKMVASAKDYQAIAMFCLPSMTSSSLGSMFTSAASSLTTTQTEMTDLATLKQCQVRNVKRESRTKAREAITSVSEDEFFIYPYNCVLRTIWEEDSESGKDFRETCLQHPDAEYIAFSKCPFGEGAERFAYRFYELAADGTTILGKPLVAKESRLILEDAGRNEEWSRKNFVRTFCRTQQLARRLADRFNDKLDLTHRVDERTPRIAFLDCSVYRLDDKTMGMQSVLVEDRLDESKWHKWNANNGYVEGMERAPDFDHHAAMRAAFTKLETEDLGLIEEGSEDDESDDEGSESEHAGTNIHFVKVFTASEVAQAFSHFTYWATGRKRLVCDLQGVYDEKDNVLRLSDPVIHHTSSSGRKHVHGRTDRGRKGKAMFFETHKCSALCRLMLRGFKHAHHRQHTSIKPSTLK
ncbi:hypothetical protein MPSEU_000974700 [Mayamaea pseudoterrestris]|nr:hypothetical protein MPSEU_000974700 [Mayamaea pseudoterrestris]